MHKNNPITTAKWRAKNRESYNRMVMKSIQASRFGGNRERAIKRDGEKCVKCNMTRVEHYDKWGRDITVDHIDNQGRYSKNKNHELNNLMTLCLACHGRKDVLVRHGRKI